jgi:uncharacterized protein
VNLWPSGRSRSEFGLQVSTKPEMHTSGARGQRAPTLIPSLLCTVLACGGVWLTAATFQVDRINAALIAAVRKNDTGAAIAALQEGADPNTRDNGGLLTSTRRHALGWLNQLRSPRPTATSIYEPTALQLALEPRSVPNTTLGLIPPENPPLIRTLIDAGADIDHRDVNGETPLMLAISYGYEETVRLLLDRGADPNVVAEGSSPGTPLMVAVHFGHRRIVTLLLARGASVNLRDGTTYTPLMCAAEHGDADIAQALLLKGARVDARDDTGSTALIRAAQSGNTNIATFLLAEGAEVNAKDKSGDSALGWAVESGHLGIARLLQQAEARRRRNLSRRQP